MITVLSFVFFLLFFWLFVYFYFISLKFDIDNYWENILEKTRLRLDIIPNLIEILRLFKVGDEKTFFEMVNLRQTVWALRTINHKKVNAELLLSKHLNSLFEIAAKHNAIRMDSVFLFLRKEIQDIGREIEKMSEIYNDSVRIYNKKMSFFLIKRLLVFIGLKTLPVFEFEK